MSTEMLEILLVEDKQAHVDLIQRAFEPEREKFNLTIAGTLAEARKLLKNFIPGLMLADYRLPDGNGIELLPGASGALTFPVAIMTGHGDEKVATTAMKAGAIDYIVKSAETLGDMPRTIKRIMREWGYITERKQAGRVIQKLSQCIEQAGESIVITDSQGIIEHVNPAFTMLTGYSAEEAIGQTPRILKSGNHDAVFYKEMWGTISSGKVWHGKVIDRKKDGSFYPSMLTISPIFDHDGDVTSYSGFVGLQSDLTDVEALEQQFHQAQKMEAVGTLVGGIAHDFNNMLAGMTGNLYLAKQQTRDMPDVLKKLSNIEQIAFRASNMIEQLLTFARKDRVSMKAIPFTPFIKETVKLLRPSAPENIAMHVDVCSDALQVKGDATQLHQVLMNLVNNARDAVEGVDDPCITVRLEPFYADDAFVENRAFFNTGVFAHVSVQDNGCGIPAHQIEHLFEPFFTTKEQGKGTGLGLAMVFGAVKTHGGFVEVDSAAGTGATFHIYIPLLEPEDIVDSAAHAEQAEAMGHGELILLVDDDACVVETGQEVLEALGYRVVIASNGQQAVDIFTARRDEIALVILDVVMPLMSGGKAAQLIRRISPQVNIIFATGYDKNTHTELAAEVVLGKPFSIVEMSHLIRQQLDQFL